MSVEADLDFAARRLDAFAAQLSQAGRVIAAARAAAAVPRDPTYPLEARRLDEVSAALADYDNAAARAAALNEGNDGR